MPTSSSHVQNLTISCIDYRFRRLAWDWIESDLDGQSDIVAAAGASKAFIDEDTQATLLKQVQLAKKLHDISDVHIVDHTDCGAYGGAAKHEGSLEAELTEHQENLDAAKQLIESQVDGVTVHTHVLGFEGMVA